MIIINLKGGLGNQMFQYACGRALALRNSDTDLFVDTRGLDAANEVKDIYRPFSLANFNIKAKVANADRAEALKNPYGYTSKMLRAFSTRILRRFYVNFIPLIFERKGNIFLDGFFQSERYFIDAEKDIREDLLLKTPLSPMAGDWHARIEKDASAVSIHVRRGDYVTHPEFGGICTPEYYERAVEVLKAKIQNPHYYVFSDDPAWVKEHIKLDGETYYVSSPEQKDYEELILMSKCKHNVIANSSFSWWGAWLNGNKDKMVIAPKKWANSHDKTWYRDIIPENWIRV